MLTKVWGASAAAARLSLVAAVAVLGVTVEARALDDGQAPIWQGLGSIVGFGKADDAEIDYREHGKLVLPPKMELPAPAANGKTSADWPTDQDVQRAKKLKALKDAPAIRYNGKVSSVPFDQPGTTVTMGATAGAGPGGGACLKDGVAVTCPDTPGKTSDKHSGPPLEWNPLTWVGLQKKADIVLGPEPGRDFLTDPPSGYRQPVEGVGAKVQPN